MNDRPVPIGTEVYVALLQNARIGSVVLGLPFGILAYVIETFGLLPLGMSPILSGVFGWIGGAIVIYLQLSKPY